MAEATEIILNPKGHLYRDGRIWMASQREFLRRLAPAEVTVAESAEEAAQVARQSALKGYTKIVCAGGGELTHGVVNGLMTLAESHRREIKLGFLSLTRPDLWSRTLELPRSLDRQLELLSAGHTLPYDVGRVDCLDDQGRRLTRYFLNGASFGVTGLIKREWRDPGTSLLETVRRIAAALRQAASPRASQVRLESEGTLLYEGACTLAVVMGGRFYPALGEVAPQANPMDGLLELAWLPAGSLAELALRLGRMLLPSLTPARLSGWQSVERCEATVSRGSPVFIEADGQPGGRLPATFTAERRGLHVIVEPVAARLREPLRGRAEKIARGRLVGNVREGHAQVGQTLRSTG